MGYSTYFKDMLRPLRLYELDAGVGAAELDALGVGFDDAFNALSEVEREALLPTAEDDGLAAYEGILPYKPMYLTLDDRRRAIMALLRIDGGSFTQAALNDTLSGCGIRAIAAEGEGQIVQVSFPDNRGWPPSFEQVCERIEQILPCHIGVDYAVLYILWSELEAWLPSWQALEAACPTWRELEGYYKE